MLTFAKNILKMVQTRYTNKDIELFFATKKSAANKDITKDKRFWENINAFFSLLEIINCANELESYKFLHYEKYDNSSVVIKGAKNEMRLIFYENDNGKTISIHQITNNNVTWKIAQ